MHQQALNTGQHGMDFAGTDHRAGMAKDSPCHGQRTTSVHQRNADDAPRVEQQGGIERQRQVSLIPGAQCLPHEMLVDGCLGDVGGTKSTLETPFMALRPVGTRYDEKSTMRQGDSFQSATVLPASN